MCDASDNTKWDKDHLTDMWTAADLKLASSAGDEGAYLEAIGGNNKLVLTNKDYYTIKNIKVVYTNSDGYISMIETDIRLKVPDIDFAQSAAKLNLEEFSLVANNSLINDSSDTTALPAGVTVNKGSSALKISGSVYGGKNGLKVGNQAGVEFIRDPQDELNGLDLTYRLIADSIDVNKASDITAGVNIGEKYDTYVEDINITSSNFRGNGNMYVGDDLDIGGRSSRIYLKGHYRGYGNDNTESKGSSSILINGADTTLDFSMLDELVLSGHAYVGAKKYDADKDRLSLASVFAKDSTTAELQDAAKNQNIQGDKIEDVETYDGQYDDMLDSSQYDQIKSANTLAGNTDIPQNTADIMMGEAMSVKANQLFYLVPSECIGYIKGTDQQIITKNPMTYAEYDKLLNTPDKESNEYKSFKEKFYQTHPSTAVFDITKEKTATRDAYKYEPVRLSVLWSEMGTAFSWIFDNIFTPLSAATYSLLAFYIASASFRAFRARSWEATLLLVTAFIVMLFRVPLGEHLWHALPIVGQYDIAKFIEDWLMGAFNAAGQRAILLGASVGLISVSLKILLGIERSYLGGSD